MVRKRLAVASAAIVPGTLSGSALTAGGVLPRRPSSQLGTRSFSAHYDGQKTPTSSRTSPHSDLLTHHRGRPNPGTTEPSAQPPPD
jgi:hypothetical protein